MTKKILYRVYDWYLLIRGWLFLLLYPKGDLVCPFCKHGFKRFAPYGSKGSVLEKYNVIGGGYRANCFCPFCHSSDRERLLFLFITQNKLIKEGDVILHIAPERNLQKKILKQKKIKYYSVDLDAPRAEYKMNIEKMVFPDNYFDLIICSHVLEHVDNDTWAMRELFRVLKPDRSAILQVPYLDEIEDVIEQENVNDPETRLEVYGHKEHKRLYGKGYIKRLKSAGFEVSKKLLSSKDYSKYALNKKESIFWAKK